MSMWTCDGMASRHPSPLMLRHPRLCLSRSLSICCDSAVRSDFSQQAHRQRRRSSRHGRQKHSMLQQRCQTGFGERQHLSTCSPEQVWLSRSAVGGLCLSLLLLLPASVANALPDGQSVTAALPGADGLLDAEFREGVVSGFLLILFSELGDKTFFIALLLSLSKPKAAVFAGTFGALAIMTVISVALGRVLHEADELLPFQTNIPIDDVLAALLLIFFGVKTLQDASKSSAEEERGEALEAVSQLASGTAGIVLSTLALVFAAEWGDKSFLATIALAAASSPFGVVAGAVAGHGVATGIAVLGGSVLGEAVSEQVVQYVGGSLFLVFAALTIGDIIKAAHLA